MTDTRRVAVLAAALLALAACGGGTHVGVGVGSGGVGWGTGVGVGVGSGFGVGSGVRMGGGGLFLGTGFGTARVQEDSLLAEGAAARALATQPSGTTVTWTNPDNGHAGSVTPLNTFKAEDGRDCRDFQQTVTIEGRTETATGTACRTPAGAWKLASRR